MLKTKNLTLIFLLLIICSSINLTSQNQNVKSIEIGFIPENIDFTDSDRYMVLEDEKKYQVWDMQATKLILEGDYQFKVNRFSSQFIKEGSGYILFPKEEVFMTIDYTMSSTIVKAFNLINGELLWETDQLDVGISTAESLLTIFNAANKDGRMLSNKNSKHIGTELEIRSKLSAGSDMVSQLSPNPEFDKLINYIPQLNSIAINGKDGLQLVNVTNGEVKWTQSDVGGGIGELFYIAKHDLLVVVGVNSSEFQNFSKPEIKGINSKTGELLWTNKYVGLYKPNNIHLYDETLVMTYYGVKLIDIKTGEERKGEVAASMEKSRKMQRTNTVMRGEEFDVENGYSSPYIDENGNLMLFAGLKGDKEFDIIVGKKGFVKISIPQDKFLLQTEDLARAGQPILQDKLNDGVLYIKVAKGLRSSYIIAINTENGKVLFETERLKNKIGSEITFFAIQGKQFIDLALDGLYRYDKKSGELLSSISHKEIGIGKLEDYITFDEGLILMGNKGVAIMDDEGENIHRFDEFNKIRDFLLSEDRLWIVEKKSYTQFSVENMEVIETTKFNKNENLFFTASGKYLVKVNARGDKLNIYPTN